MTHVCELGGPWPIPVRVSTTWKRDTFGMLANEVGAVEAVEVGVDQGVFACAFLKHWAGHTLYLIDPYEPYDEMPWDRSHDRDVMFAGVSKYPGRTRLITTRVRNPLPQLNPNHKVRFIYIDGQHTYKAVRENLELWYSHIQSHGLRSVLAGHDWSDHHDDVRRAVVDFFTEVGGNHVIHVTDEVDASWYTRIN